MANTEVTMTDVLALLGMKEVRIALFEKRIAELEKALAEAAKSQATG